MRCTHLLACLRNSTGSEWYANIGECRVTFQNDVYTELKASGKRKRPRKPRVQKEKVSGALDGKSATKDRSASRTGKRSRASGYSKPIENLGDLLAHSRKRKFVATLLDEAALHALFPDASNALPSSVDTELEITESRLTDMLSARKAEISNVPCFVCHICCSFHDRGNGCSGLSSCSLKLAPLSAFVCCCI